MDLHEHADLLGETGSAYRCGVCGECPCATEEECAAAEQADGGEV